VAIPRAAEDEGRAPAVAHYDLRHGRLLRLFDYHSGGAPSDGIGYKPMTIRL
jgi:hypothetical protein